MRCCRLPPALLGPSSPEAGLWLEQDVKEAFQGPTQVAGARDEAAVTQSPLPSPWPAQIRATPQAGHPQHAGGRSREPGESTRDVAPASGCGGSGGWPVEGWGAHRRRETRGQLHADLKCPD